MLSRRTALATGLSALAAPAVAAPADGYAEALAKAYGGPLDPVAAHNEALAAAKAAQATANALLNGWVETRGPFAERLRALWRNPRWLYADDEAGRDQAVADMNARVEMLRRDLPVAFGDLPMEPAAVQRMPTADVAAGKGGYRVAPANGQPGAYYVDLRAIRDRPAWSLPTVAFHEVIPGHLFQLPLQAAAHPPAVRVKAAGAYFEAWGTYAEQLARDLGAYAYDPKSEIGYLHWRLFRLGRAVADTGLGAMGWSRERAIAELTALQGVPAAFIGIEADVDRMIAQPGKVAAEGLGALALHNWRPKDRARWPAYHRAVLADGPWPFGELERRVRAI